MAKTKKNRCWVCGSLHVIKWGVREGKQRFRCKDCGALNTRRNQGVSRSNRFILRATNRFLEPYEDTGNEKGVDCATPISVYPEAYCFTSCSSAELVSSLTSLENYNVFSTKSPTIFGIVTIKNDKLLNNIIM